MLMLSLLSVLIILAWRMMVSFLFLPQRSLPFPIYSTDSAH